MKRAAAILALLLSAAACATNPANDPTRPQIDLEELTGPQDIGYVRGAFDVQYQLTVANPGSDPITLRRVELQTTGGGGAYAVRRDFKIFQELIAPGTQASVTFWMHAISNYYPGDIGSNSPVSIRGVATFDSPKGSLHQVFVKLLSQFPE
ncbi:MAG: hypothetical protein ACXV7D_09120 [Thermoanaerobaculia bacterium]